MQTKQNDDTLLIPCSDVVYTVPADPEAHQRRVHAGGRRAAAAGAGVCGARPHRRHLHAVAHRQLRRRGLLQGTACKTAGPELDVHD